MAAEVPHHHGYLWTGPARALAVDGPRRPAEPPLAASHRAVFEQAEVPPNELSAWLLRPARQVAETFAAPGPAAGWLIDRVRPQLPRLLHPWGAEEESRVADLHARTLVELRHGQSASWGCYLTGERFFSISLVACSPNDRRPRLPCPLGGWPAGGLGGPGGPSGGPAGDGAMV